MKGRAALPASPWFAASVVVLLTNDHFLKRWWPGWVTGKLSDVAGVAMLAMFLTLVSRRRGVSFAATALGFTLLKTIGSVAEAAAPALGGVTRTDVTDLLALLVLWPTWRFVDRLRATDRASPAVSGPRDRRWSMPLQVLAVSAAVFATTATSSEGVGVYDVGLVDGRLVAWTSSSDYESTDGGRTWTKTASVSQLEIGEDDCVADGSCFELGGDSVIEVSDGFDDVISVELSEEQRRMLNELDAGNRRGNSDYLLSIAAVDLADGAHVVVSMGAMGVLHRPPSGVWEWVAVGEFGIPRDADAGSLEELGPIASRGPGTSGVSSIAQYIGRVMLLLVPVVVGLGAVPVHRLARRNRRNPTAGIVICVVFAVMLLGFALFTLVLAAIAVDPGDVWVYSAAFSSVVGLVVLSSVLGAYARSKPLSQPTWPAPRSCP